MADAKLRLGIDLGGSKTEIIALDEDGNELMRQRDVTRREDYQGSLQQIAQMVAAVEQSIGRPGSVGIAMPGSISPATGLVKNANSTWLNGRKIDRDLEQLLARPVRFRNDADCFALSEAIDGAAAGSAVVFGVIVGTGTGAGIVVNGQLLTGPNSIAGEWGHNPLPWPEDDERPGPACYCGLSGCIETWLSGPGLAADYQRHTRRLKTAIDIVACASQDPQAEAALARYEVRLAKALAHVINILDPETIVLGGGLSNVQRWYERIPALWDQFVFSDQVATRLVAPKFGDSSGVRGAAWLW